MYKCGTFVLGEIAKLERSARARFYEIYDVRSVEQSACILLVGGRWPVGDAGGVL